MLVPRRRQREIELERLTGIDAVERLAPPNVIADLLVERYAGTFCNGSAGQSRQPVQPEIIDRRDRTILLGNHFGGHMPECRARRWRPLCIDDALHCHHGCASVQQLHSTRVPCTATKARVIFQNMTCYPYRLLAKVRGRRRITREHLHHILRLQDRSDAPADRLTAVGQDDIGRQTEAIS